MDELSDPACLGTVAVIGLGYIGLPTAAALARHGVAVVGHDVNLDTVAAVAAGEVPFVEPDLAVNVRGAVSLGHLTVSATMPPADVFIIAVPTPFRPDRSADLSHIEAAVQGIAKVMERGALVILESTSPPGTTEQVCAWLSEARPDLSDPRTESAPGFHVAHCPERVLPGRTMIELVTNDRVIGGITPRCAQLAARVYQVFSQGELLLTDATTAEMSKLVENAYRDVNLAFANEVALVSEAHRVDAWEVISLANRHPRVAILNPGPGVGGHCIAVDPWFLIESAPALTPLMRTAREVNDGRPGHVAQQVVVRASTFKDPVIACLGLSYKANIDDTRESPAVEVVEAIARALPAVPLLVCDPFVTELPTALADHPSVRLERTLAAVEKADIVVLLVDHDQFRSIKRTHLEGKAIYDTRGAFR